MRDGDGWVDCGCGGRHWGRYGAAGLCLYRPVGSGWEVLLQHRAVWSHQGGTWALPGGARTRAESALAGALREAAEEAGVPGGSVTPTATWVEDHGRWSYTTVVAEAVGPVEARAYDAESIALRWVEVGAVPRLPLHPGFATAWPSLRALAGRRLHLLVDPPGRGARPADVSVTGIDGATSWWPKVRVVESTAALAGALDELRRLRPEDPRVVVTADPMLARQARELGAVVRAPGPRG